MTGNRGQSKLTKFRQTSWWFCIVLFILIVILFLLKIWYGFCKSNKVEEYKSETHVGLEHIALCFCVRDCEPYLKDIFTNIDALRDQLRQTKITCIFVYDNCKDNSEQLLLSYQSQKENVLIENIVNQSRLRTVRIAKARNKCLELLHELQNVQYHFMIDSDDKGSRKWNLDLISTSLQDDEDEWDCLSFNCKGVYYDCWALMFDDFKHQVWGFPNMIDCRRVEKIMLKEIKNKLKDSPSDSIDVMSAFNGFAIYKTQRFVGFHYDGECSNFVKFFTNDERTKLEKMLSIKYGIDTKCLLEPKLFRHECCEHLFYHLSAYKRGRKIKISKFEIT